MRGLAMNLLLMATAAHAGPAMRTLAGLQVPEQFRENETLSVAGQRVYEHITDDGQRDLLAITPAVRERSIRLLLRGGYRDYCRPRTDEMTRILFHRHSRGLTWFLVARRRTIHLVLDSNSRYIDHFRQEVSAFCRQ